MGNKMLVLHIAVPGINVDDWDDLMSYVRMDTDGEEPTAEDMGKIFTRETMREDVGLTIVTLPGEKCGNDDFMVVSFDGRVIGASLAVLNKWGRLVAAGLDASIEDNNDG